MPNPKIGMKNRTIIQAHVEEASLRSKNINAIARKIFKIIIPETIKLKMLDAKFTPPLVYLINSSIADLWKIKKIHAR
jgi:hypothetical protein